jgi:hypothetical protein
LRIIPYLEVRLISAPPLYLHNYYYAASFYQFFCGSLNEEIRDFDSFLFIKDRKFAGNTYILLSPSNKKGN